MHVMFVQKAMKMIANAKLTGGYYRECRGCSLTWALDTQEDQKFPLPLMGIPLLLMTFDNWDGIIQILLWDLGVSCCASEH